MAKCPLIFPQTQIIPSILSSDFGCLAKEAQRAEVAGATALHLDVMDGFFVPNFGLGIQAVAAINKATNLFLDVHLMIYNPCNYIDHFVAAGADRITFHFEATGNVVDTIALIRKLDIQVGLAFSPITSYEAMDKFLPLVDTILIMTVDPGFGGQPFIPFMVKKIEYARTLAKKLNLALDIEVDGGISDKTIKICYDAGANLFVAGTYIYKATDMKDAFEVLNRALI
jgi:ribulose-phosphate 3-epimerase